MAGVAIALMSRLECLKIWSVSQSYHSISNGRRILFSRRADTEYMFGLCADELNLSLIPGFAKLKHFFTGGTVPWQIMALPTLETLQIGFVPQNDRVQLKYPITPETRFSLTNLTMRMNFFMVVDEYYDHDEMKEEIYAFTEQLFTEFKQLKRLSIQFRQKGTARLFTMGLRSTSLPEVSSYANVANMFRSSTLETLILDTSDVDVRAIEDWGNGKSYLEGCIAPMTSLHQFPNLKTIIAPQQAFFDSDPDVLCDPPSNLLPPSIRSIEIIDASKEIVEWIGLLIECENAFPVLNQIEFWCDHSFPLVCVEDTSPWAAANVAEDINELFEPLKAKEAFHALFHSRMNQLNASGISVFYNKQHQGWRTGSGSRGRGRYEWDGVMWQPMFS